MWRLHRRRLAVAHITYTNAHTGLYCLILNKLIMKRINRFYFVFACAIAVLVYCLFNNNPYQNALFILVGFIAYTGAMAYLFDDAQANKYNESEKKFVRWVETSDLWN